ncbi:MAG: DNA polymerase I [Myxococcota bacterium]
MARRGQPVQNGLPSAADVSEQVPLPSPSRAVLVDGTNSLYRAFFAIPGLRAPDGAPTNAAYGFVNMLLKVMREERPDYVAVVFDARGKTFRHRMYPDYKATRDAQPEDLSTQIPMVRELLEAYRIPLIEIEDFEADDVIATLVAAAPADCQVAIVSTDKDLMQLVDARVSLLDGMKDRRYGPAEVEARFGVPPDRVLDMRALVGDPSDNIPGVKGIGEKGAAQLIREWNDLENLIEHREEIASKRARNAIASQLEEARLSKRLATLRADVPLPLDFEDLRSREPDRESLRELFARLGFTRLLDQVQDERRSSDSVPARIQVQIVNGAAELASLMSELSRLRVLPIGMVMNRGRPLEADPVAVAMALAPDRAAYIPLEGLGDAGLGALVEMLGPVLGRGGSVPWIGRDTKGMQMLFAEQGCELNAPAFDVEIAGSLLDPAGPRGVAGLAAQHLGETVRTWEDLVGRGAKATPAAEVPRDQLAEWLAGEVCAVASLHAPLAERLAADDLDELFDAVELPLTRTLARMERAGVRIDEARLGELSREYGDQLEQLEGEIHALAGETFLVSSPKQLQVILFEKLKLPVIKKTKTGYSTDEDVLEKLAAHHELPARILAYRRLAKLKNTYVDALPPLVNRKTGRIHPTFHQLGAATGRLSATDPNVQNIPIRTPEGVKIREAFIAAEGHGLLSADYSQVELRILAHYSEDESLIQAFRRGEDIHRLTAAEVAGISPDRVTADQRARAKAVNFGIIYGSSAFGLARQLGIATGEAQETIDAYFARYDGVRRFLDRTVQEARERGWVRTLLGRRRYLPDLGSRNRVLRNAAERMAVNSVVQGTAADLIKKAMLAVDAALEAEAFRARMILQVHDELVFEAPESELERLTATVRERMEGVLSLRVPLVVDVGTGRNWREAH